MTARSAPSSDRLVLLIRRWGCGAAGRSFLRELPARMTPCELLERLRAGFAVPPELWLHDPLRTPTEGVLATGAPRSWGLHHAGWTHAIFGGHLTERREADVALWPTLMFRLWPEARTLSRARST
jgi:hypothetical protein